MKELNLNDNACDELRQMLAYFKNNKHETEMKNTFVHATRKVILIETMKKIVKFSNTLYLKRILIRNAKKREKKHVIRSNRMDTRLNYFRSVFFLNAKFFLLLYVSSHHRNRYLKINILCTD